MDMYFRLTEEEIRALKELSNMASVLYSIRTNECKSGGDISAILNTLGVAKANINMLETACFQAIRMCEEHGLPQQAINPEFDKESVSG